MGNFITCIIVSIIYTLASFFYLKQNKKPYPKLLLVIMSLTLIAFCIFSFLRNNITLILELEFLSMIALCFPVTWVDIAEKKIPNNILLAGLVVLILLLISRLIFYSQDILNVMKSKGLGFLLIAVFCGIGIIIIRDGIGMGDVKLLLLLSLYSGLDIILSVLFFTMVAAFFAALYELIIKRKGRKASIAFAPEILFGVLVTLVLTIYS